MKVCMVKYFLFILSITIAHISPLAFACGIDNHKKDGLTIEHGVLTKIDRSRTYYEIKIPDCVTTLHVKEIEIYVENKGKKDVMLFEDVRVTRITFNSNLGKTNSTINSTIFRNVIDLKEIIFQTPNPQFKEERSWYKFGEGNWRDKLSVIEFDVESNDEGINASNIDFASSVSEIRLSEKVKSIHKDAFSRCSSLRKITIPYILACDLDISWTNLFKGTKLEGKEVISSKKKQADDRTDRYCLVQTKNNGNISNHVTDIRSDALKGASGNNIQLPIHFRSLIKKASNEIDNCTFYLKEKSIYFSPEVDGLRNVTNKFNRLFSTTQLSISSAYQTLHVSATPDLTTKSVPIDSTNLDTKSREHTPEIKLDLSMNTTYTLGFRLKNENGESIPVKIFNHDEDIAFITPEKKTWEMAALLWCFIFCIGIPYFIKKLGIFLPKRFQWKEKITIPYSSSHWVDRGLLYLSFLFLIACSCGIVSEMFDIRIWTPVTFYLNASMISSFIISISTTTTQILLGLFQGIKASAIVVSFDLREMLNPILEVLSQISKISWISSLLLTGMRLLSELIRNYSTMLFTLISSMIVVRQMAHIWPKYSTLIKLRFNFILQWMMIFYTIAIAVAVLFPLSMLAMRWMSGELFMQIGMSFETAMTIFNDFTSHLSWGSVTSISELRELSGLLGDALSKLLMASLSYLVMKLFDCFVIPLIFLYLIIGISKKMGYNQKSSEKEILTQLLKQNERRH